MAMTNAEKQRNYSIRHGIIQKPPRDKVCENCGEIFVVQGYGAGSRKFCSKECAAMHTARIKQEAALARASKVKTAMCAICGKEFALSFYDTRGKYCSKQCKDSAKSDKNKKTCIICGESFHTWKTNATCSEDCKDKILAYNIQKQRINGRAAADIREIKKKVIERVTFRKTRDAVCCRLRLFRKTKNAAEVARLMQESETATNALLRKSKAYRKAQEKRSTNSNWRKTSIHSGSLSAAFKTERSFVKAVTENLRAAGMIVEQEVSMPGSTRRKIDLVVHSLFGRFGIECKNGNKTSDADQCFGQALIKCRMKNLIPVCCFPSDSTPDPDFMAVARSFNVPIANETNIVDKIMEVNIESSNVYSFNPAN
jgi:hypothetical protein